ncbi:MAG: S26 family signal peptidase, partial [Planctomycetota bacterium]
MCVRFWRKGNDRRQAQFQVVSGSMMPHVLGPHYRVRCRHCGSESIIRADREPQGPLAWRCANCGGSFEEASQDFGEQKPRPNLGKRHGGDQLLVSPLDGLPSRFEMVAFVYQKQPHVKRVWGLPGEEIEFFNGDLFLDGQRFQKTVEQFHQIAITVAKLSDLGPRWRFIETSGKSPNDSGNVDPKLRETGASKLKPGPRFRLAPDQKLEYRHRVPANVYPDVRPEEDWMSESKLMDDYPFERSVPYALMSVRDVGVELRLDSNLATRLRVALYGEGSKLEFDLVPDSVAVTADGMNSIASTR